MYKEISARDLIIRTEEEKNSNCQGESFVTVVALRRAGCYKCCSYSCSFAKTEISFATFLLTSKDGTSEPLPLTSDRHRDPLILQTILL